MSDDVNIQTAGNHGDCALPCGAAHSMGNVDANLRAIPHNRRR